jgi:hypothetical protein
MSGNGIVNVSSITVSSGSFLAMGTYGIGSIPVEGEGARLMWYPAKAAFRSGYVESTQWDDSNIGSYSTAMGWDTTASELYSTAMGQGTTASGQRSTATGSYTTASGEYSTAMGYSTIASGDKSTAMGSFSTASGEFSTAMGSGTTASGNKSTAMGLVTTASGQGSTAMGYASTAAGDYSTAIGSADVTTNGLWSVGAGQNVRSDAANNLVLGSGVDADNPLLNDIANSLMIGFNRTTPALFVSQNAVSINNTSTADGLNVSTINAVSRINFADGTVMTSTAGFGGGAGDNLGNHTATQNLNMNNFDIINASSITTAGLNVSTINSVALINDPNGSALLDWNTNNIVMGLSANTTFFSVMQNAATNPLVQLGGKTAGTGAELRVYKISQANTGLNDAIIMGSDTSPNSSTTTVKGVLRVLNNLQVYNGIISPKDATVPINIVSVAGTTGDVLRVSTGTDTVFRVNGFGNAFADGSFTGGGADYAEWFEKEGTVAEGDVVGMNPLTGLARKYVSGDVLLGVCSAKPGFVGNKDPNKSDEQMKQGYVLVGLVGQLTINSDQINITGRKVETKDGKQLGYLLGNGKVFVRVKE